jgi:hypothetical protein
MSVHSEFQRILDELVRFLERTGAPGCAGWASELVDAATLGRTDVSGGADRTLTLLEGDAAPTFTSPLEIEEFARVQEHLLSLCHVILGR